MIKNNKGITLSSLMIYIIGMIFVIAIISNLTTYFYKNIDIDSIGNNTISEYTSFLNVFSEEINLNNNYVIESKSINENNKNINYIVFSSGNQYTFKEENTAIYKNNIRICQNIENCEFSYKFQDSKYLITVKIKIKDNETKEITYTLKNSNS